MKTIIGVVLIVELWESFTKVSPILAHQQVNYWEDSKFRLERRLSLFGSANPNISADFGFNILAGKMKDIELFDSNSTGDVFNLIQAKWGKFSRDQRNKIEERILGFSQENKNLLFPTINYKACFDLLAYIEKLEIPLSTKSKKFMLKVRKDNPNWKFTPLQNDSFRKIKSKKGKIPVSIDISDPKSVDFIIEGLILDGSIEDELDQQNWRDICSIYPSVALSRLVRFSKRTELPSVLWSIFLSTIVSLQNEEIVRDVINVIEKFSDEYFNKLHFDISLWLKGSSHLIDVDVQFWKLFDRVASEYNFRKIMDYSINDFVEDSTSEHLADILISILTQYTHISNEQFTTAMQKLQQLVDNKDQTGSEFILSLSWFLPILFKNFPTLVKQEIIPYFEFYDHLRNDFWTGQRANLGKYSPELFKVLKNLFVYHMENYVFDGKILDFFVKQLILMEIEKQLTVQIFQFLLQKLARY